VSGRRNLTGVDVTTVIEKNTFNEIMSRKNKIIILHVLITKSQLIISLFTEHQERRSFFNSEEITKIETPIRKSVDEETIGLFQKNRET